MATYALERDRALEYRAAEGHESKRASEETRAYITSDMTTPQTAEGMIIASPLRPSCVTPHRQIC